MDKSMIQMLNNGSVMPCIIQGTACRGFRPRILERHHDRSKFFRCNTNGEILNLSLAGQRTGTSCGYVQIISFLGSSIRFMSM